MVDKEYLKELSLTHTIINKATSNTKKEHLEMCERFYYVVTRMVIDELGYEPFNLDWNFIDELKKKGSQEKAKQIFDEINKLADDEMDLYYKKGDLDIADGINMLIGQINKKVRPQFLSVGSLDQHTNKESTEVNE